VRRRAFILSLHRLRWLLPPPAAPALARRDPSKPTVLQKVLERAATRKKLDDQRAAVARGQQGDRGILRGGSQVDGDDAEDGRAAGMSSVLSNYDLCHIVMSYI
jgi:hypothetical protein